MQKTIFNAAKAYDPKIQVVTAPINTAAVVFGQSYMKSFLAAGGGAYSDIIAFHGYPEDVGTNSQVKYYNDNFWPNNNGLFARTGRQTYLEYRV